MFYFKDEATDFKNNIENIDEFKSYKYKAKLLENTEADGTYGILRNTTITGPLKYLSNFRRSLKMLLISSKVELKFRWTTHCVLLVLGVANSVPW